MSFEFTVKILKAEQSLGNSSGP